VNIPALLSQLEEHEGFRSSAYADSEGWLTIGIGRLIDARKGGGITREEARYLLGNDVTRIVAQLGTALPWWLELDDVRQNVLVEMGFQLGVPGLLKFKNTLRAVEAGDWHDAAAGMLASKWAKQTPKRAEKLARQMREGRP
jgi:lysozyme